MAFCRPLDFAGGHKRRRTSPMMFKNLTVRELLLTLNDARVAELFHEGLATNNSIMAMPAMSELFRRGDIDSIYANLWDAIVNEKVFLGTQFTVTLGNVLTLLGDRDKKLKVLGEEFVNYGSPGVKGRIEDILDPKNNS
ncbi:hypothetical protein IKF43_01530 [Candidatus Saccharibacteria bacterium]|nr:hypothetical protein [Candidatus Saccharibacteria bacterium]